MKTRLLVLAFIVAGLIGLGFWAGRSSRACESRRQILERATRSIDVRSTNSDAAGTSLSTGTTKSWAVLDLGFANTRIASSAVFDVSAAAHNVVFRKRDGNERIVFVALADQSYHAQELRGCLVPANLPVPTDWQDAALATLQAYQSNYIQLWKDLASGMRLNAQIVCEVSEEEFRREVILERLRFRFARNGPLILVEGKQCVALVCKDESSTNVHMISRENGEHFEVVLLHWSPAEANALAREIVLNFQVTDWAEDAVQRSNARKPLAERARAYVVDDPQRD